MLKILFILSICFVGWMVWLNSSSSIRRSVDEELAPCPNRPNCVSSYATDSIHQIDPLPLLSEDGWNQLIAVITSMPGATLIVETSAYLHVEFRSRWLGFVDDLECRLDAEAGVIHVRSASRVGYSDMGVNRRRVEEIRTRISLSSTLPRSTMDRP